MNILCIRTDNPMAELSLFENEEECRAIQWEAHRKLAETLHSQIELLLKQNDKQWKDINGVVMYAGPGSFTGLRIGFSVGNAIAYANSVQIIAEAGEAWKQKGIEKLTKGYGTVSVVPEYGGPAHTT